MWKIQQVGKLAHICSHPLVPDDNDDEHYYDVDDDDTDYDDISLAHRCSHPLVPDDNFDDDDKKNLCW